MLSGIKKYKQIKLSCIMKAVPKQIVIKTGEEEKLTEIIDSFFIDTKEYIEQKYPGNNYFNVKYFSLGTDGKKTDEELQIMLWKDRVVAGVLCTRTDFNNVQYTFFRKFDEVKRLYENNNEEDKNK
jgi:hypothetical protein